MRYITDTHQSSATERERKLNLARYYTQRGGRKLANQKGGE